MQPRRAMTVQSFVTCLISNALLLGLLYFLSNQLLDELRQIVDAHLSGAAGPVAEEMNRASGLLADLITRVDHVLLPVLFGLGAGIALLQTGMIRFLFRRFLDRVSAPAVSAAEEPTELPARRYAQSEPQAAMQILSILQRKGRFIDFLEEDLSLYDDAQIGAAARSVHQGCKDALAEHLTLKPVLDAEEGLEVSVPDGFDPGSIQLIGEVKGAPPFKGILRHRGWCVDRLELPRRTSHENEERILAPAEVEVGG